MITGVCTKIRGVDGVRYLDPRMVPCGRYQLLEVRCCCKPENLLGWLPTTEPLVGRTCVFVVRPRKPWLFDVDNRTHFEKLELRVELYQCKVQHIWPEMPELGLIEEWKASYPAFSAHETPIEVLRRTLGFIERLEW